MSPDLVFSSAKWNPRKIVLLKCPRTRFLWVSAIIFVTVLRLPRSKLVLRRWDKGKNAYPGGQKRSRRPVYGWGYAAGGFGTRPRLCKSKNGKDLQIAFLKPPT